MKFLIMLLLFLVLFSCEEDEYKNIEGTWSLSQVILSDTILVAQNACPGIGEILVLTFSSSNGLKGNTPSNKIFGSFSIEKEKMVSLEYGITELAEPNCARYMLDEAFEALVKKSDYTIEGSSLFINYSDSKSLVFLKIV